MALSRSAPGVRMGDMRAVQDSAAGMQNADSSGLLTATASGVQSNGVQLTQGLNEIGVCATNGDSAQLPPAVAGSRVRVGNSGAATASLYGKNGRTDTINGVAGSTAFSLTTGKNVDFFCAVTGRWRSILTA